MRWSPWVEDHARRIRQRLFVEKGAKVLLYIDEGASLTVIGADANGSGVGRAAIELLEGSTLTVSGGAR